jgi:RNA-directed DNA polymerase
VRKRLNRLLGGWSAYFGYGTLNADYRAVDRHVCDHIRRFLNRRAKRGAACSPGTMFSGNSA